MPDEHSLTAVAQAAVSEQALGEGVERYRRLFELFPDAVLVHSGGKLVMVNTAGAKLFGAERPEDMIGMPVMKLVHPDYSQLVQQRMAVVRKGGFAELIEEKVLRVDGSAVDVEVTAGTFIFNGQPAVQVIVRNITKRKRLQFQNAQLTLISQRLNSATNQREAAQVIAQAAQTLLGWDAFNLDLYSPEQDKMLSVLTIDEIDGRQQETAPANHLGTPTACDRRVLRDGACLIQREGGAAGDFEFVRFGDKERPSASMLFAPIRNGARVSGIVAVHSYKEDAYGEDDLALLQLLGDHCAGALERLRAEEALRESQERFHTFMDYTPVVAFMKNEAGQYLYGNPAWARQFNKQAADLLGKTDFDLRPEPIARQLRESDAAVLAAGKPLEFIKLIPTQSGGERWWMVLKFPIQNSGFRLLGGLAMDVTERHAAEEELNRSRAQLRSLAAHLESVREEERTRLAREIHDELGQLLTGFKMDLSWMDKRLEAMSDAALRRRLTEKTKSMSAMVDDMVDSVRRISAELRPGALDDLGLVAAMDWQLREVEKRVGFQAYFESDVDPSQLPAEICTAVFRIFQEALTNIARHASATQVNVSLEIRGQELWLCILDNGRGITPEQIIGPKSLGLAGMRERATVLGGEFKVERAPGKGTLVSVRIPLCPPRP